MNLTMTELKPAEINQDALRAAQEAALKPRMHVSHRESDVAATVSIAIAAYLAAIPQEGAAVAVPVAWRDILAERQRQISAEGWTHEHDDDKGPRGELATAAACYAAPEAVYWGPAIGRASLEWPWQVQWWKPSDGKRGRPLDRRRDLIKAGALILAEIERLDRAAIRARPAP